LIAATVNVYDVPFARPVTVNDVAADPVTTGACATPPTYGVTTYPEIALPPFDTGADHDTTTCPSPAAPDTALGEPGTPVGVTGDDAAESAPAPTALIAATVNVYAVPFVSPVTVKLVAEPVEIGVCGVPPTDGVIR
jgi:hypothetical protein